MKSGAHSGLKLASGPDMMIIDVVIRATRTSATASCAEARSAGVTTMTPACTVRRGRDFGQVPALTRAHAIPHKATRDRDNPGRIVATVDDYGVVDDVLNDL